MDLVSPDALFQALRESGLHPPARLRALEDAPSDPSALAHYLFAEKLLTIYQARKVRTGHIADLLIGQYLVVDKIGEGGMGRVYSAIQLRMGRTVALKVVRTQLLTNRTVMKRYQREAAAAATLNHPNIVALLDADEAAGRHYMALEFIDGSDLSRVVKEFGPLPYPEACEYLRQACLGLQHAHEQGFVHRDIKPSNLLVSGDRAIPGTDGRAVVKILDMGLVRCLFEDEDASRTELTRAGTVVGTPDYMSPEQAKNSSTVDHRADIYSLGCTLYFLLTGQTAFPAGSPIDKLLRHQLDPPPSLREARPEVPAELERLYLQLMAKRPEDRLQTAAEVGMAVARFATGAPLIPVEVGSSRNQPFRLTTTVTPSAADASTANEFQNLPTGATPPRGQHSTTLVTADRRTKWPWLIGAGLGIAAMGGVLAFAFSAKKAEPKPPPVAHTEPPLPKRPPPAAEKPKSAPVVPTVLPPVLLNLPNEATAVAVLHPQQFFARYHSLKADSKLAGAITDLQATVRFDPTQCERLTLSVAAGKLLATAEGSFVSPEWFAEAVRSGKDNPFTSGEKFAVITTAENGKLYAGLPGAHAYAISNDRPTFNRYMVRTTQLSKAPTGVSAAFLAALPQGNSANAPFLTLVADGFWMLPDGGPRLSDFSVTLAVVTLKFVGEAIVAELSVRGSNKIALNDFLGEVTAAKLMTTHPRLRAFLEPFTQAGEAQLSTQGDTEVLKTTARWNPAQAMAWLEAALGGLSAP